MNITLPDESVRQFDQSVSVAEIAESIGSGLAKAALAGKVDDKYVDTSYIIDSDARVAIITAKDPAGLEILRHSTAHLLAHAVKDLFPEAQVTIGPVIENGFYYDFAYDKGFTPEDLEKIEQRMYELVAMDLPISRHQMTRNEAIKLFQDMGEHYKIAIIEEIPETEVLSFYKQGNFIDLCRGPHVPSTGKLKVFKLMTVAGAYWRGDSNNKMLQRIYGTAWANKNDLQAYLKQLEEAEKRDHRKLAKKLDLFHLQEEAPGMVFWHPNGWVIYQTIEQYLRKKLQQYHYQEVKTPQIVALKLWQQSGHWEKFNKEMFTTQSHEHQSELPEFAIKPMSCPCHVLIYNQELHSYRDLPLRLAEFGLCHRNEPSGSLHGLMRVRGMVQDDAHIFCTEDQLQQEIVNLIHFVYEVYQDFGFTDISVKLATRPLERIGFDAIWDKAEMALAYALEEKGVHFDYNPGEGAFYGPKIEFTLKDCLGRTWQCGTIQVDFAIPERLGATYVAEDSSKKTPIMIHRAILGSLERFIGILIEHYAGFFPTWLAPKQIVVMNITDKQTDYAIAVTHQLKEKGFRVIQDLRNEKIGFKIREHSMMHIPYMLILGEKEKEAQVVTVRSQSGKDLGQMPIDSLVDLLNSDIQRLGSND